MKKLPRARRCPTCEQAFSGEARFCPFDGDALIEAPDWNPSADPLLGQTVDGRYEVLSVIGEGGMGTVYEVRHATLGRHFALKVLRRDLADAEHTARFIQEAKAAAAIGHPNIVAVSDFGELAVGPTVTPGRAHAGAMPAAQDGGASPTLAAQDEGSVPIAALPEGGSAPKPGVSEGGPPPQPPSVPFFVMEYLSGISLASLLRAERTLDPHRAAEIVVQCAAGLSAAHAAGVIHRDLKPDNIFLTRNGDREFVKLLDFGVAKIAGAGRLTRAGMVFGTPHYMSPEQAAGQSLDHRADIYALGVILYECLAGKVPFEADTYMGVLTKHMFATPEPIEHVVPDASSLGALGSIAMRCLAKSPHDRFSSMAELESAIEHELAGAGIPRTGMLRRDRPRLRERADREEPTPGLRPVVGPVGIALGLGVALFILLGVRVLSGARLDVVPIATATPPPAVAPPPTAMNTATPVLQPPPPVVSNPEGTGAQGSGPPVPVPAVAAPMPSTPPPHSPARPAGGAGPRSGSNASTKRGAAGSAKKGDVVDPWNK